MQFSMRSLLPPVLLILAFLGFMAMKATRPQAPPVEEEQRRWPVSALPVTFEDLSPSIRLFGQISTDALTHIRARSAGDIDQVWVQAGDFVAREALLMSIDPLDAQADYDQRYAEHEDLLAQQAQRLSQYQADQRLLAQERELVNLAERQLERNRQLAQANRVSTREVEVAEQLLRQQRLALVQRELAVEQHPSRLQQLNAAIQRAESQRQIAERNLKATAVTAPEAGRVVSVQVAQGDNVTANTILVSMLIPERVELVATLPLRYVSRARALLLQDTEVTVRAEVDGERYEFVLDRFAAQTDRSASLAGLFRLTEGEASQLPLGRFIEAQMILPLDEASIWVPAEAIYGRDRVYRILDGRLEAMSVQLLGDYEKNAIPGFLISADDLSDGDLILASRLPQAVQGLAVEIVDHIRVGSDR